MAKSVVVSGKIVFDGAPDAMLGLTVRVVLEDVSQMDMPAKLIAEQVQRDVVAKPDGIPFQINGELPHENHRYEVRAHVSRDGSADFKKGDFISTASHAIDPAKPSSQINIRVQAV